MVSKGIEELIRLQNELNVDEMAPEELALLAQDAVSPSGTIEEGTILARPTSEDPFGVTAGRMETAGWVSVWDKFTYEWSRVNRNMLPAQLAKTDDQGRRIFTTVRPRDADGNPLRPWRGSSLCMLHPDAPNRAEYDRMGLPVCKSGHIANEYQVELHMQHRHKNEWAQIEAIRTRAREEEERLVRQAIIKQANMSPAVVEAPTPVVEPVVEPEPELPEEEPVANEVTEFVVETPVEEPKPRKRYPKKPTPPFKPLIFECPGCGYVPREFAKSSGKRLSDKQRSLAVHTHMRVNGHGEQS